MGKVVALGEIMLRLSTMGEARLAESTTLAANYGGGEANVAISLANYGHQAAFASKVPDNALGLAVKQHLNKYAVDTTPLLFGGERLGTYFLETGIGFRSANVIYDRKYSAFSEMKELDWDFDQLFENAEIFHISGITAALSAEWQEMLLTLAQEAQKRNVKVSFDINYRGKLWTVQECGAFVRRIAKYVDILSAARLDALNFFLIPEKAEGDLSYYYQEIQALYPNITVLYSTTREVFHANHNALTGNLYYQGALYRSETHDIQCIVDRVGGGDAFAAGILHGLLNQAEPQKIIDFASLASAMKHTVHGDHNQFSAIEIEELLKSGVKEIKR